MELDDQYYALLKTTITETAKLNPFSLEDQDLLYNLSRILLTDLINYSYSQEYIYWVVNEIFYNQQRMDLEVDDALEIFWSYFDFRKKDYIVILPLKSAALQKHLKNFQNVTIKNNNQRLFHNSCKWIIELEIPAMDIYQAQTNATQLVSFFVSLGQFTRNYTQTVKRAADNKRRYAPGWVHSTCLLRGFPKGAAPHLAHDFAEQSVVCYTLCRRCPENTVAAGEGKGI